MDYRDYGDQWSYALCSCECNSYVTLTLFRTISGNESSTDNYSTLKPRSRCGSARSENEPRVPVCKLLYHVAGKTLNDLKEELKVNVGVSATYVILSRQVDGFATILFDPSESSPHTHH